KLKMDYPARWIYKLVGPDPDAMRQAVAALIADRRYTLTLSRQSRTAKYTCLNLELNVESESHRLDLYESLKRLPSVKIVL
ncbi:MAG TPA: DUF493 domain-containing protein, partial [Smithellaceae bacterium]|nr:DUF493 domain-containing protein [Smithellaceae bacterium]